ncbi:MAG: hypothetical protein LC803_18725 [Acidobacteria bacterium]|nr:hypothetical protein [Acidobacteriota bacterium]
MMRPHRILFALALVAAMQMPAAAQQIFGSIEETVRSLSETRPAETPKETTPVVPPELEPARVPPAAVMAAPLTVPTPLLSEFENERHADTYRDAYRILKEDNSCSRFFGGPVKATDVLNHFAEQLKPSRMVNIMVAIQMGGAYMHVRNPRTGASYRLFEQVMVNSEGPFSMAPMANAAQRQFIGHFRLNTRPARALILLHELGHLVQRPDGHWLLPNDGDNPKLSVRNTRTVESHCWKQLTSLRSIIE